MLDSITHSKEDAINILKADHNTVRQLFKDFENAKSKKQRVTIAGKVIKELQIHAAIEENIFYPTVRKELDDKEIMNESDEEHHVAKLLIAELSQMTGDEEHYEAKFNVLAENIKHHIKEEEGQMFPQARSTDVDMDELGHKLLAKKKQLKAKGVPKSAEEKLMTKANVRKSDSPAATALKLSSKAKRSAA